MQELRSEAEKTKISLSSKMVASISSKTLEKKLNFTATVTRAKFEELSRDIFESLIPPLHQVIECKRWPL
jgi:molecular chaperone DnaK (HSP70)